MSTQHDEQLQRFDDRDQSAGMARKRLFIGLISVASLLFCLFLVSLWVIPYVGLSTIHPLAPWVLGVVICALCLVIGWASLGLVLNILLGRSLPYTRRLRGLTIKLFLPMMVLLGKCFGISKQRVRSSFIKVNNELVLNECGRYEPAKVLLLMPHCLQNSRCEMRLTYDVNNCKRCGKCPIKDLLEFSERYGVHLAIATGGTIARRNRGPAPPPTHHRRCLRARSFERHPGRLSPALLRGHEPASQRPLPGHDPFPGRPGKCLAALSCRSAQAHPPAHGPRALPGGVGAPYGPHPDTVAAQLCLRLARRR